MRGCRGIGFGILVREYDGQPPAWVSKKFFLLYHVSKLTDCSVLLDVVGLDGVPSPIQMTNVVRARVACVVTLNPHHRGGERRGKAGDVNQFQLVPELAA